MYFFFIIINSSTNTPSVFIRQSLRHYSTECRLQCCYGREPTLKTEVPSPPFLSIPVPFFFLNLNAALKSLSMIHDASSISVCIQQMSTLKFSSSYRLHRCCNANMKEIHVDWPFCMSMFVQASAVRLKVWRDSKAKRFIN